MLERKEKPITEEMYTEEMYREHLSFNDWLPSKLLKEELTKIKLCCECGERLSATLTANHEWICSGDPWISPIESRKCVGIITLSCKKCTRPIERTDVHSIGICQVLQPPRVYEICSYAGDDCYEKTMHYMKEFCKKYNLEIKNAIGK